MDFYSSDELTSIGFHSVGKNVLVSRDARFFGAAEITLGDNVRIDAYSIISAGEGGIYVGNNVHIACFCSLIGSAKIELENFSGLSARVSIYSSSDDYSGSFLTNPTIPTEYRNVTSRPVKIGRHVIIGAGSVVLPGVTIKEGAAIGALSLVSKNCESNYIYSGTPAKKIKRRNEGYKILEQEFSKIRE